MLIKLFFSPVFRKQSKESWLQGSSIYPKLFREQTNNQMCHVTRLERKTFSAFLLNCNDLHRISLISDSLALSFFWKLWQLPRRRNFSQMSCRNFFEDSSATPTCKICEKPPMYAIIHTRPQLRKYTRKQYQSTIVPLTRVFGLPMHFFPLRCLLLRKFLRHCSVNAPWLVWMKYLEPRKEGGTWFEY